MAKRINSIRLSFPLLGLSENWPYNDQPALSSPHLQNVRAYDVLEKRARGGQRPGLRKLYSQQIGGDTKRIDCLVSVQIPSLIGGGTVAGVLDAPEPITWSADYYNTGGWELGTIAIVKTSKNVTLTGATWPSWVADDRVLVYNDIEYEIASRTNDTVIVLADAWALDNITGKSY